jgi:hypothetical protein
LACNYTSGKKKTLHLSMQGCIAVIPRGNVLYCTIIQVNT